VTRAFHGPAAASFTHPWSSVGSFKETQSTGHSQWPGIIRSSSVIGLMTQGAFVLPNDAIQLSYYKLEMWAYAQRDGRPAKCKWRPMFNAAVWLTPTTTVPCSNAAKTRNPVKFTGVSQTRQQISAASGPKFTILRGYVDSWRRYCCLTSFFLIVDMCLICEDIARQSCALVPRLRFFASCTFSKPHPAHFRPAF